MYWMGVLISCPIPAASSPMDSSFCAWASWLCMSLRSVIFAPKRRMPISSPQALCISVREIPRNPSFLPGGWKRTSSTLTRARVLRQVAKPCRMAGASHGIPHSCRGRPTTWNGARPKVCSAVVFHQVILVAMSIPIKIDGMAASTCCVLTYSTRGRAVFGTAGETADVIPTAPQGVCLASVILLHLYWVVLRMAAAVLSLLIGPLRRRLDRLVYL